MKLNSDNLLRKVACKFSDTYGYILTLWDTNQTGEYGKSRLAYRLTRYDNGKLEVIFKGSDYFCAPSQPVDSDDCLRSLLTFLTLREGDTDSEYFADYTAKQLAFRDSDAENLAMWADGDSDAEFPANEFIDIA